MMLGSGKEGTLSLAIRIGSGNQIFIRNSR